MQLQRQNEEQKEISYCKDKINTKKKFEIANTKRRRKQIYISNLKRRTKRNMQLKILNEKQKEI
jgi:hypothetical protein